LVLLLFFIFVILSIKIPFQRAQIVGSTAKIDWAVIESMSRKSRKVCAAINKFEKVFSINVVCPYFLFFYASNRAKKKLRSENFFLRNLTFCLFSREPYEIRQKTKIVEKWHSYCQNGLIFFLDSLLCTKSLFLKF
jgi:hypothetical protein